VSEGRTGPPARPEPSSVPSPSRARPQAPFAGIVRALRGAGATVLVCVLLLVGSTVAFLVLQHVADVGNSTVVTLTRIDAGIHEVSQLEWQLIAERRLTSELDWKSQRIRRDLSHLFASLPPPLDGTPAAARVVASYRTYVKHIDTEMDLLRRGQPDEAIEYDERYVDPAYEELEKALDASVRLFATDSRKSLNLVMLGSVLAALVAFGAGVVLALRAAQVGRLAAEAAVEERASRAGEQRFRALFDANPQPMWLLDPATHRFIAVNDAALEIYGYDRTTFLSLRPADIGCATLATAAPELQATGAPRSFAGMHHMHRSGTPLALDVSARIVAHEGRPALLAVMLDAADRVRMETRLRESQRMETVGRLASGVAHDFNNLVTTIVGYTQLLLSELPVNTPGGAREHAHEIWKTARRATSLTQQLIHFGRTRPGAVQSVHMGSLVGELQPLVTRLLGEDVRVNVTVSPGDWRVRGERGVLEQMVMNLVIQARSSMPRGGRLSLRVEGEALAAAAAARAGCEPGEYVTLSVTDTGVGMDEAALARLLDVTETDQDGVPSTLASARLAIEHAGGRLLAQSTPGRGTIIRALLPRDLAEEATVSAEAGVEVVKDDAALPVASLTDGSPATLLLVEDDAGVRDVVRRVLETCGHNVLECSSAERALAVAAAHSGPIHLMVTDVVMPGMNGRELAEALAPSRPGMRVLYMSGYTEDRIVRQGVIDAQLDLLQKPFELSELESRVQSILTQQRAAA
jgi:two-component system cell cycle sensor histidine kinase/response regulator CckA